MQILAISGSLRAASANTNLLKAAAAMAPEEVTLSLYDGLGDLPPFNPDVDKDPPHAAVAEFRCQLRQSAGVVACIVVPLLGKNLREDEIAAEPDLSRAIRSALKAFARATSIHSDVTRRTFLEHEEPVGYER